MRSITLLTLFVVCLLVAGWVASARKQDQKSADAGKSKTLREMVRERDVEFDRTEGHFDREYEDLRWLAKHSDAIVLGRILEEESYFSGHHDITTRYKVEIQRVIKDERPNAGRLSQSLGKNFPAPLITLFEFYSLRRHRSSQRTSCISKGQG